MSNIEKDIKRCEELIKKEHANWIGISNQLAIAHVVDRVKELEEENRIYVLNGNNVELEIYIKNNYISKSKLIEEVDKLLNALRKGGINRISYWNGLIQIKENLLEDK